MSTICKDTTNSVTNDNANGHHIDNIQQPTLLQSPGQTLTIRGSSGYSQSGRTSITTPKHRHQIHHHNNLDCNSSSDDSIINDRSPMMADVMDSPKTVSPSQDGLGVTNRKLYDRIYYMAQLLGVLIFVLILIWLIQFLGGIGFSTFEKTFNFHPLFMFLGFIIIYSNAMLIYRSFRMELKHKLKLFHTIMNAMVMLISLLGSLAAIYFHHKKNITHFYSLHSWLGITTWFLFVTQFYSGFVTFLFPGASLRIREKLMPFHRLIGIATFILASATCITGFNEKAIFAFGNVIGINGILTNIIGLLLCIYCGLIIYLVTKSEYQRRPLSEEQVINLSFDLISSN